MALKFPGTRWLMGRAKLKTLRETTFSSFLDLTKLQGLIAGTHYKVNNQNHVIYFYNGSQILMKDLFFYPSDPNFDELGSLEITGAFIDEVNQIVRKAWNITRSRIRYKLKEYCPRCANPISKQKQLKFQIADDPESYDEWKCNKCGLIHRGFGIKILGTCNPAKNFVYTDFYDPYKKGRLESRKRFIQSLVTDNPFIAREYIEELKTLEEVDKQRLLYGNWDYEQNDFALFPMDVISDIFSNPVEKSDKHYISADVARYGKDLAVIMVFKGFGLVEIHIAEKCSTFQIIEKIVELQEKFLVPRSRVVVDDGGIGGGIVDALPGCKGFISAASPEYHKGKKGFYDYKNLRAQCYFKFSEFARNRTISLKITKKNVFHFGTNLKHRSDEQIRDDIRLELQAISYVDADKDSKVKIIPKDEIKQIINRSPDFSDTIMMFCYLHIKPDDIPIVKGSDDRIYNEVDQFDKGASDWNEFGA